MGTVLELSRSGAVVRRLYVSGDTLTGPHLDEIAERFPTIDTAVVHLGGTRILFNTVTLDDVQGVDLLERVGPREVVPVHHADYGVFRSPLSDFLARAGEAGWGPAVTMVEPGRTVSLVSEAT
jgi:L-ascorbate metabolism protein UlaG (beta-lactamase superfamily)